MMDPGRLFSVMSEEKNKNCLSSTWKNIAIFGHTKLYSTCDGSSDRPKEYVASIIELYKNNGAVLCVAINFLCIWSLYLARTLLIMSRFARNEK